MAESAPNSNLARLVEEHHEVLYRYAFRLTGSVPDAEDLAQQTFLLAQQKLDQLRQAENARGWLFAILRNCYLKGFRKRTPIAAASIDLDVDSIPAAVSDGSLDGSLDGPIDAEVLQLALNELSAEFRLVVMMFYFEERSYREMAEILDVPLGTIMSRLSRAKACLRRQLFEPEEPLAPGRAEPFAPERGEHVAPVGGGRGANGLTGNGLAENGPVKIGPVKIGPAKNGPAGIEHSATHLGPRGPLGPPTAH